MKIVENRFRFFAASIVIILAGMVFMVINGGSGKGIFNFDVEFTGEYSTLIVRQIDKPGVVAHITQCLSRHEVNIAFMRLFREDKGATAFTIVESDEQIPEEILDEIHKNENVQDLMLVQM